MGSRAFAIVAILCLAIGAAGGWLLKSPERVPVEAPAVGPRPSAASDAGAGPALSVDTAQAEATQAALVEERALRTKAQAALVEATRELATYRAAAAEGGTVTAQRYSYEKYDKALQAMDWKEAGQAISKMGPLLLKLADAMANGKPYIQIAGDLQRYNGPLVRIAGAAQEGGLPGTGVNGAFTHPSVLANLVYATLKEAGVPLDKAQEAQLEQLGDAFIEEDARRLAGYDDMTLGLKKLVEETALKDRFYAAVDGLVTDEQREVLHPEALRGRVSFDLFSSGLVWGQRIAPLRYRSRDDLEATLVAQVLRRFGVAAEEQPLVEAAAGEWARSFPDGFLDALPDALELSGRFKVERVRVAARASLAFYEALIDRLPADAQAVAMIRGVEYVGLPLKRP